MRRRGVVLTAALTVLLALTACTVSAPATRRPSHSAKPSATHTPRALPTATATPTTVGFDKSAHSVDDPNSIWVVVNKARPLNPIDYAPPTLVYPDVTYVNRQPMRPEVADALVAMFRAGKTEAGLDFSVQSAYRSFESQTHVYDDDVARHGQAFADTDTARPGHSEHQTGLAVDISAVPATCSLDACFGTTRQGVWLTANSWRFGFILRYTQTTVPITGFTYEPWHFRYVGIPLSTELHTEKVQTLEEFFGVPGGTEYH
ncbi:MAG: M15 family metallopeptidase [Actinobacteria bacterium]|nr:M15 family metallopeptidase [Actinomycetota bacterium]